MNANIFNSFEGSKNETAELIESNMQKAGKAVPCRYPFAFSKHLFRYDINLANDNKPLNETMADCILMPQRPSTAYIKIPECMHPIEWLTPEESEPVDNAWTLLRLARNEQVVVILPLLDARQYAKTKYQGPVEFVGFVISTTRFAVTLELLSPGVHDFMRHLLTSTEIVKIFGNCVYEAPQLYKVFGVALQQSFCLSTALKSMIDYLGFLDYYDEGRMPNLTMFTGVRLPPVTVFEEWKKPGILNFIQGMYGNAYFMLRFRRHPQNAFQLFKYGFNWTRSPTFTTIFSTLPEWFGQEFWSEILSEVDTTHSMALRVATTLYCCHPSLMATEAVVDQCRFNSEYVYAHLAKLAVDAVKPYDVNVFQDDSLRIMHCLVNWVAFEKTDECIIKYQCIAPVLIKLKYHAPLFCQFVDTNY